MQPVSADFQPALQQIKLRAFARSIRSFHHNNAPGYARLGTGLPGCGSVDFAGSARGAFCTTSCVSVILFERSSLACDTNPSLLLWHYNTRGHLRQIARGFLEVTGPRYAGQAGKELSLSWWCDNII